MIFKFGDQILDTETTPVALIFKTKEEAETLGSVISSIKNGDSKFPKDGNGFWWMMHPSSHSREEIDEWSVLTDDQKILLEQTGVITTPDIEL